MSPSPAMPRTRSSLPPNSFRHPGKIWHAPDSSKVHIIENHRFRDQYANVNRSPIGSPLLEGRHNEQPFLIVEATSGKYTIRPVEKINSNLSWHCPDKVNNSVIELRAASTADERNLWTFTRIVS
ncbi:hypothetical protein OF83DRAFT_1176398 [Amylostereum chailletii]|nr:hypothetical protein OF83DRAFT_1176398 [Amylostereum chailletii]